VTGIAISRHLKISYSASVDLAYIALWNGLRLSLKNSSSTRTSEARALTLRDGELFIRRDRDYDNVTLSISKDGGGSKSYRTLRDLREALEKVRTTVESYRRPWRAWWAVVPADQYPFTKFL
jgi:hypothetical protein